MPSPIVWLSALVVLGSLASGCAAEDTSGTKLKNGNGIVVGDSDDGADPSPSDAPAATGNGGVAPIVTPSTPPPPSAPAKPAAPPKPAIVCNDDTDSVKASYFIALQRDPDPGGLVHWVGVLQGGETRLGVLKQILQSPEFIASREQLSNEDFVTSLYRSFFDRAPDPVGFAGWVDALAGGASRSGVAIAFADSEEFRSPANRAVACYF